MSVVHLGIGPSIPEYFPGFTDPKNRRMRWSACGLDLPLHRVTNDQFLVTCHTCLLVKPITIARRLELIKIQEVMDA